MPLETVKIEAAGVKIDPAKSKKLAALIGPVIIVLIISEALNPHIWLSVSPAQTYLAGALWFVAGFLIIRIHHLWKADWRVMITLVGWFAMLGGMGRMLLPEIVQQSTENNSAVTVLQTILMAVGIFLTYIAYGLKGNDAGSSRIRYGVIAGLLLVTVFQVLLLTIRLHVPRTVQFDNTLSYTEIDGYKYHTEVFGKADAAPVIIVHGGPGLDYAYLKALKNLSNDYQIIFYDQRGTGLSPRVEKKFLTIEQNLNDLHAMVKHFSNGKKVKLIGHSWGATLVVGYLSKHSEMVSQAVIVEPFILYPGAPVKEWVEKFKVMSKDMLSIREIAPNLIAYPFVRKEDGQEGYDYVGTKIGGKNKPGPPYNCADQDLPPNTFKRMGYAAYNTILKPVIDDPATMKYDFTQGISAYHGDLLLLSGDCSILGPPYQEKYAIPKLPPQTVHVKAVNMGHHMITLNTEWSLQTIRKFLK